MNFTDQPAFLALMAAVAFGLADFSGSRATRSVGPALAVAAAQAISAAMLGLVLLGGYAELPHGQGMLVALGVGAGEAIGLYALYYGLAHGRINVVAPLTGIFSVLLPTVAELLFIRRSPPLALVGIGLAALAVFVIGRARQDSAPEDRPPSFSVFYGVLAGLVFGTCNLALSFGSADAAIGSVFLMRLTASAGALSIAATQWTRPAVSIATLGGLIFAGFFDALGMIGFLRAVTQGLIGVSSALLSMSVGVVIVLGYFIAKEKINRWQLIGLAIGAFSIVILAGAHG